MNRRKAIVHILLAGGGAAALFSGYEWYQLHKAADIGYLESRRDLIAALAETIIPATDTPGAMACGVHDFIIKMVRDCTEGKTQVRFIDGLKDLERYCRSEMGKPFQQCTEGDREAVLAHFEKKGEPYKGIAGKIQGRYMGKSFFSTLKEYTVEGYCTSEPGATQALAYVAVPGHYSGCLPYQAGQKAWATN